MGGNVQVLSWRRRELCMGTAWGQHHNQPQQGLAQLGRVAPVSPPALTALSPDVSPMDAVSAGTQKDELMLRIVVRMPPQHIIKGVGVGSVGSHGSGQGAEMPLRGWMWCSTSTHLDLGS